MGDDARGRTLARVGLLSGLPAGALADVARDCAWKTFAAGQQIVSRSARDRMVYFVVAGKVRVSAYSGSGRELSFRDLPEGSTFGELSAIDGEPRSADVQALTACTIACLPPRAFREVLDAYPQVMERTMRQMVATIRSLSERLFELSTLGVQNRVHAEVLRLAKEAGAGRGRAEIRPSPPHDDIAKRISTTREAVTKELSAMARLGLVAKGRGALVVPDVERLERHVADVLQSPGRSRSGPGRSG